LQLIALGALMVGTSSLTAVAVNFTTAINASLVNASQPTVTALFAFLLFRDRLRRLQTIGIMVGLLGVVLITAKADWRVLLALDFNLGDLLMFIAACGYGIYAINLRRLPRDLDTNVGLFAILAAGAVCLLPLYIIEMQFFRNETASLELVGAVLYSGLLSSLLAMYFWNTAILTVGANRASIFLNLLPIFGVGLSITFLGESLYSYHFAGFACICLGILMVVRGGGKPLSLDQRKVQETDDA
jgi:drug/metabolite transporter (DMT)-like permease